MQSPHYGATLIVDRQPRGKLPVRAPIALSAGLHLVEVTAPGRPRWARLVWIDAGAETVLAVRFSAVVAVADPETSVPGASGRPVQPGLQPGVGTPSSADLAAFGPGRVAAPATTNAGRTDGPSSVAGDAGGIGGRRPTRVHLAGSTGVAFARAGADADVDVLQRFEVAVADLGPNLDGMLSGRAFADLYTSGRALRRVVQPSRSAVVRLDDARLRWRPGAWQGEGGRVPFLGPGRSAAAVDGARLQSPATPGDGLLGGWQAHLLGGRGVTPFGPRPEHPLLLGLGLGRTAADRFATTETRPQSASPQAQATGAAPRLTGDAAAVWYDRRLHLDAGVGLGTAAWQTGARTGWVDDALAEADLRIHAFAAGLDGGLVLAARRPVGGPFRLVDAFADPALALRPDHHAVRAELGGGLGALGSGWTRHLRWGLDGELRRARDAPAAANPHLLRADLHLDQRLAAFDLGLDLSHLVADAGPFDPTAANDVATQGEPAATQNGQIGGGQAALLARQRLAARARWRHQRLTLDATLGASRLHLRDDAGGTQRRWLPEGGGRARLAVATGVEVVGELSARAVHPQLYPGGGPLWDGLLALVIR